MQGFDYVIVGAGSAGCVLANRLSADPSVRVLLVEEGGPDRSWNIHVPGRIRELLGGAGGFVRTHMTEPQEHLEGRRLPWLSGRVWGGTSSINGLAYMRGQAEDYDGWRQMGLAGWSYAEVLPYFRRAEANVRGEDGYHGASGPLHVDEPRTDMPLTRAFLEAGQAAGFPLNPDFNGASQEGFGRIQMTTREGRRWSTASAYLRPALDRPNLTIRSGATVTRVLTDKTRATGIEMRRNGGIERVTADREVILSAGTVGTPQVLLLSGIGDADALRALGIPVVADRKDVGRNLQDHVACQILQTCREPVTLYNQTRPLGALAAGLRYLLDRSGPASGIGVEAYASIRSGPAASTPDIHVAFLNAMMEGLRVGRHGFTLNIWHLRPDARGAITLASADPAVAPRIQPNYFSEAKEAIALREAIKTMRDVIAQPPLARYAGDEIVPGPEVRTDAEIDAFLRRTATGLFHPVGSARMGADEAAVVDPALRVNEMEGLRVVDASVMPRVPSANTNAPVIMIAEKAADLILGRTPPPPAMIGA